MRIGIISSKKQMFYLCWLSRKETFAKHTLEIFNIFLWLKSSPSLNLNKIEHFPKVSQDKTSAFDYQGRLLTVFSI